MHTFFNHFSISVRFPIAFMIVSKWFVSLQSEVILGKKNFWWCNSASNPMISKIASSKEKENLGRDFEFGP